MDDRLGALVEVLGKQPESLEQIELDLGHHLIRAYALPTEVGRCDTSSFSVYHQLDEAEASAESAKSQRTDSPSRHSALQTVVQTDYRH